MTGRWLVGVSVLVVILFAGIGFTSYGFVPAAAPPSPTPSPTPTISVTPSSSSTRSPTISVSPSLSRSPTPSHTPARSSPPPSPTRTPTTSYNQSATSTPRPTPAPTHSPFYFWNGLKNGGTWYEGLDVNANMSFTSPIPPSAGAPTNASSAARVQVDWVDHYAVQLFANPDFLKTYDDRVRAWNPNASLHSGAIDSCGWGADAGGQGWSRRTTCYHEDFKDGWDDQSLKVLLAKSCCTQRPVRFANFSWWPGDPESENPPLDYSGNIGIEEAVVEYPPGVFRRKNVLRLTALNSDDTSPQHCGGCIDPSDPVACPQCHKSVFSAGLVQTSDLFASGRYEVVANVPEASGMVWAMWTFHYEEHIPFTKCADGKGCPQSCDAFGCYKQHYHGKDPDFPPSEYWGDCCGVGCCSTNSSARPPSCPPLDGKECECCSMLRAGGPCPTSSLCDKSWGTLQQKCMTGHTGPDLQFPGNATINSWKLEVNHEIDIEIPANCEATSVCSDTAPPSMNFTERKRTQAGCINRPNTANLNNYIFTTSGGTGPAYSNMCVGTFFNDTEKPLPLIGGDKYRKYTIEWHTGGVPVEGGEPGEVTPGRVDFYVDDIYLGTNNVFVPTRASRLVFGMWPSDGHQTWNNWPDDWAGTPGDGHWYTQHTYISEIKVQPFNEPNDVMYPDPFDQPTGCDPFYLADKKGCHPLWSNTGTRSSVVKNAEPGALKCGPTN